MWMDVCTPKMCVYLNGELYLTMSPFTWSAFAYFRTLARDCASEAEIELESSEDMLPFWRFVKNDFSYKEDAASLDEVLQMKKMCIMFGLEDGHLLYGRLLILLVQACHQFCNSKEFYMMSSVDTRDQNICQIFVLRDNLKRLALKSFLDLSSETDPRYAVYDACKKTWNGETI